MATTAPLQAKIRVLLVDDSPIARRFLSELITATDDMEVVAEASNGVEAVRMNSAHQPDIIAMDMSLPLMDGLQAAELIMQENPNRIVLFTEAWALIDNELLARATAIGALDVRPKPLSATDEITSSQFVKTLRALARVSVIQARGGRHKTSELAETEKRLSGYPGMKRQPEIVLVVSSTGGPHALGELIRSLPADFPLPIVIVQHIDMEFMGNLSGWLQGLSPLGFKEPVSGERPQPNCIYIAPIGMHLRFAFDGRFLLEEDSQGSLHVPSGTILLESAAHVYGPNAIGVILTGMGSDGAAGLLQMRQQGARTIAQDEQTSVVFGMPKEAIALGAAEFIEPLEKIAPLLVSLVQEGKNSHEQ